eukprot:12586047-Alexandrium_andersonii.AAC.1
MKNTINTHTSTHKHTQAHTHDTAQNACHTTHLTTPHHTTQQGTTDMTQDTSPHTTTGCALLDGHVEVCMGLVGVRRFEPAQSLLVR